MSQEQTSVAEIHAVNYGVMLLSFGAAGECRTVNVLEHLGDEVFFQTFGSFGRFAEMTVEKTGGVVWSNGFRLSGPALYQLAKKPSR